jgi:hypothetical protein
VELIKSAYIYKSFVFEVEVFWIVTPCGVAVGYQRLGPLKRWYPPTTPHGFTTQKTST